MKVKMVKMGHDVDEITNHRIRGIVPTIDGKFLFIEIILGTKPNIKHTNLNQNEYTRQYPHEQHIWVSACFRVDIPTDYRYSFSPEFKDYHDKHFYNMAYTKENVIKVLQIFNPNIEDIELTDTYYIDKFCEEKGFYEMFDKRLEYSKEPTEFVFSPFVKGGRTIVTMLYTCYASNGTKCQKDLKEYTTLNDLITQYGKDKIRELAYKYIEKKSYIKQDSKERELYIKNRQEVFDEIVEEIEQTNNLQIDSEEHYDLDY